MHEVDNENAQQGDFSFRSAHRSAQIPSTMRSSAAGRRPGFFARDFMER
jgi:hypothetical protein